MGLQHHCFGNWRSPGVEAAAAAVVLLRQRQLQALLAEDLVLLVLLRLALVSMLLQRLHRRCKMRM